VAMTARTVSRIVLGVGALLVVYGAVRWWHGERVFARMRATTCTVLSKKVESKLLVSTKRPITGGRARYRDEAHLVFAHTLDGRQYTFTEDFTEDWVLYAHAGYEEGRAYPCRYDPQDPGHGTITTAFDPRDDTTTLLLGGVVMLLGAMTPQIWRGAAAGYGEMRGR
jgi:Protein of unknown function (DUF3592)